MARISSLFFIVFIQLPLDIDINTKDAASIDQDLCDEVEHAVVYLPGRREEEGDKSHHHSRDEEDDG